MVRRKAFTSAKARRRRAAELGHAPAPARSPIVLPDPIVATISPELAALWLGLPLVPFDRAIEAIFGDNAPGVRRPPNARMILDAARGFYRHEPSLEEMAAWRHGRDLEIAAEVAKVEQYAAAMADGTWQAGKESSPVERGRDGRHRLLAVIKLGRPVELLVRL